MLDQEERPKIEIEEMMEKKKMKEIEEHPITTYRPPPPRVNIDQEKVNKSFLKNPVGYKTDFVHLHQFSS